MDADINAVNHHWVIAVDIILTVELVKYFFSCIVRSVRDDIITPFDRTENISAFLSIQNSWALDRHDFFVRVRANEQCVD